MDNAKLDKQNMRILDFTLKTIIISGGGRPNSWSTQCKRLIYYSYTVCIVVIMFAFILSQFFDLILYVQNSDEFADNLYALISVLVSTYKLFCLLINRSNIAMFVDVLAKRPFRPIESDEVQIYQKFNTLIRFQILCYSILIIVTIICYTAVSFLTNYKNGNLIFRAWLPFDYSSSLLFLCVYIHQIISLFIAGVHHMICDSLLCGFLMHICCQIEILKCRLRKCLRNPDILRECVRHHSFIYKFSSILNDKFKSIIFIQFFITVVELCFSLYQATTATALKYIQVMFSFCSLLSQVFFYCWYGNEVKLRSRQLVNNIFEMDWFRLDKNSKNTLLMIMRRGAVPIEFNCAYIITVNLETFMTLLKMSYSAYNILQQT